MKVVVLTHAKLKDLEDKPKKFSIVIGPGVTMMALNDMPGITAISTITGVLPVYESEADIKKLLEEGN